MTSRGSYGKGYQRGFDAGKAQAPKSGGEVLAAIICSAITAAFGFWLGGVTKK